MVGPLKNFLKTDMEELISLQGMTKLSEDEMEAALSKHSKLSKRDSDKKKLEINQEVTSPDGNIILYQRTSARRHWI